MKKKGKICFYQGDKIRGFRKKNSSNIEGISGKEEARKHPTYFIHPASRRICDRIDCRSLLSKEDKIQ
jgi:hypothetical protein